ncbi:dihydrofolate reductase-like domain-containing protein [Auriculariales sp. MPI-PUGE-AT-0066]|nr:dihydrofolate reductase-like domain-containing protein [Auriculariales sp. MPI-PUGE-AT-0066]
MTSSLTLIVAATVSNGIGHNGGLPWKLPREMAYFKRITTGAAASMYNEVIMGRNTWESIPPRFRPLAGRVNVVLSSRDMELPTSKHPGTSVVHVKAIEELKHVRTGVDVDKRFLIGGAQLYSHMLTAGLVDRILLTRVLSPAFEECDVKLSELGRLTELGWKQAEHESLEAWVGGSVPAGIQEENGVQYEFQMWERDVNEA